MILKFTIRHVFLLGAFLCLFQGATAKNLKADIKESVLLTEFLENLSNTHEVFFTYKTEDISNVSLNPNEYSYKKLKKVISKLEKNKGLQFEYLGDKYYVVYNKNEEAIMSLTSNGINEDIKTNEVSLQQSVSGTVVDDSGMPLPGVNILEKGTYNGTTTDFDGNYSISVSPNATLVFSYVGYSNKEVPVNGQSSLNVTLSEGESLDQIVLVGTRTAPRSNSDTPLPVDVLASKEIASTGQATFDKALQYRIPSFNTVQTPVNDATSLLDPYEIRNMGPSRTLILINGKRKNLSALLYTQTSPGRGETGADISGIPTEAIKRVEILRDGASAQYGSDAIAGVMNIILKDEVNNGSATVRTGFTSEGDGEMYGFVINNGTTIGEDKGFINYTIDLGKVNLANRPGTVSAEGEIADFTGGTQADVDFVNEFLSRNPDANNINGSPETTAAKFAINGGVNVSENSKLYFDGAYVYKKVNSFANYRVPYWRTIESFPYLGGFFPGNNPNNQGNYTDAYGNTFEGNGYDGYVPTFDGDLNDYNATFGFRASKNDWNYDASMTVGGNRQTYKVRNSHNRNEVFAPSFNSTTGEFEAIRLYQENSQIEFDPGGTQFNHIVGNLDVNKRFSDHVSIAVGAEFRSETFTIIEGELSSYDGGGADSFAGNRPENSGKFNRYNLGAYFDLAWDISDRFLINATMRTEDYSDFGNIFVYKLSSRYKFNDRFTLRSSYSTGFRAPTLHQIYTQKAQYSFIPGQGIQVGGLISNISPQARLLGIPRLDAEKSTNFTIGFGGKLDNGISFTFDYYNIAVDDRIVLGTEIGPSGDPTNPLDILLTNNNLSDVSFFSNAIDTRTSGIDVVISKNNISLGNGELDLNLSGNHTISNERDGAVKNVDLAARAGQSVVNSTQEALFFTSRPRSKWILGGNYQVNKFGFALNNTYFGKTTFKQQGMSTDLRTEFIPKIVTDLAVTYNATDKMTLQLNINNLLNVLPEWEFKAENAAGQALIDDTSITDTGLTEIQNQSNLITFNQRYSQMTYDGYHFSQLGTMFNLSLNYKF